METGADFSCLQASTGQHFLVQINGKAAWKQVHFAEHRKDWQPCQQDSQRDRAGHDQSHIVLGFAIARPFFNTPVYFIHERV